MKLKTLPFTGLFAFPQNKANHIVMIFLSLLAGTGLAQDSLQKNEAYKNIVRFNLTNPMIFGQKSLHLGYERVLKNNRSMSLNVGRAYFPQPLSGLVDTSLAVKLNLDKNQTDRGFCIALDFRFYLQKENKFQAPHGVYIGPYYSFSHFERDNTWTMQTTGVTGTLTSHMNANIHMTGVQMGYQFILWKRMALDFILIGPGLTFYDFKTTVQSDLGPNFDAELWKQLYEALTNRFPGYSYMLNENDFTKTGTTKTSSLGFRYVIHIGYLF